MNADQPIKVVVTDWPVLEKQTELTLDHRIFDSVDAVREHLENRFGAGKLSCQCGQNGDDCTRFRFTRTMVAPPLLRRLAGLVLNKSIG